MKSKEDIIKQYEPYPNKAHVNVISIMMEEYAKEYATDFIERISRNEISCYSVKQGGEKKFYLGKDYVEKLLTAIKQ